MWKRTGIGLVCALTVCTFSPAVTAQEPVGDHNHDGFFLRLGLNLGPLMLNEKAGAIDNDYSGLHFGSDLMLGGTPVRGLVLGGFLTVARTTDPKAETAAGEGTLDGTLFFAGIGVFANYYFDPREGFHIQGLIGVSAVDFVTDDGRSGSNDPTGTMFGIGAGYDVWIGSEWSIGPFGRFVYAPMSAEAGPVTVDYKYMYPSIGVAFTYH